MEIWQVFFIILGVLIIIYLIQATPRKKNERIPSIEGIDDPEVAKSYERMTRTPPFKLLRKKVISQLKKLNLAGNLIDLGCGSGNLIIQIANSFPNLELIGVDVSNEIISIAEKQAKEHSVESRITFKIGNVTNLPFPDNSIDFIVSTFSLHHWSEPIKGFKEIFRVLKKNGTCLIFDFRRNSRRFFYEFLTFATKVVVPKALKRINEPLGSLKASYTSDEIIQIISHTSFKKPEIKMYLAWMFINIEKN